MVYLYFSSFLKLPVLAAAPDSHPTVFHTPILYIFPSYYIFLPYPPLQIFKYSPSSCILLTIIRLSINLYNIITRLVGFVLFFTRNYLVLLQFLIPSFYLKSPVLAAAPDTLFHYIFH